MKDKPVDECGNISISLENTMRLLEENANSKVNEYFFAVYDFLENAERESNALRAENNVLKDKIKTDKFNYEQLHKFKNHLQQENQALKNRWEKLKKFVSTPKEIQQWDARFEVTVDSIKAKMQELGEKWSTY